MELGARDRRGGAGLEAKVRGGSAGRPHDHDHDHDHDHAEAARRWRRGLYSRRARRPAPPPCQGQGGPASPTARPPHPPGGAYGTPEERAIPFLGWVTLVAGLLLAMALVQEYLKGLYLSTSVVYLAVGVGLGALGVLSFDPAGDLGPLEHLTELAVVLSLFIGGLKLRLPLRDPAWAAAWRLAGPAMVLCIAGTAAVAHWGLGLPPAAALLLGAVLAPTDPVLASAVSVNDARDHDRLRYGLSGEAGLNDGTAFPFVVFALLLAEQGGLGSWVGAWAAHRLGWAIPAALAIGFAAGYGVGRVAIALRTAQRSPGASGDLLAIGLVLASYAAAEAVGAWGFLAAFAAGVGLRRAEMSVVRQFPHPEAPGGAHPPAETLGPRVVEDSDEPAVAAGQLVSESITFGETAERLLEVLLVLLVGVMLYAVFDARGLWLAAALFLVVRPAAAHLALLGTATSGLQRWMMAAYGVRGIGTLYYVVYAVRHGAEAPAELIGLAATVVAASVVVHGATAGPALQAYERALDRAGPR